MVLRKQPRSRCGIHGTKKQPCGQHECNKLNSILNRIGASGESVEESAHGTTTKGKMQNIARELNMIRVSHQIAGQSKSDTSSPTKVASKFLR